MPQLRWPVAGFSPLWPEFDPRPYVIYVGRSGIGADSLEVLQFPLPNLIPPTAPRSPFRHQRYLFSILAESLNNESKKKYRLKMRMFIVVLLNPSNQMQG
jgi:hypothetical protein